MDRRTPPQHYWSALLRASFEGPAAKSDDAPGTPGDDPSRDYTSEAGDLVARVMADIERHAVSAAATRNRIQVLRADAGAALQAAAIAEAKKDPDTARNTDPPGGQGHLLDVRR